MEKDINKLSRKELIQLVKELFEKENNLAYNKIVCADFEVETHNESLHTCREVMKDLIKTHTPFVNGRREKMVKEKFGMIG